MSLKSKALSMIARKEYSRIQLYNKLTAYSSDSEVINSLLDEMECLGYISDSRYVDMFINSKKDRYGRRRLINELKQKGVSLEIIQHYVEDLTYLQQLELANQLVIKKYGNDVNWIILAKIQRFLQ